MLQLIEHHDYQLGFAANDFICRLEMLRSDNLITKYRKQTNKHHSSVSHRAASSHHLHLYCRGKQFMFLSIPHGLEAVLLTAFELCRTPHADRQHFWTATTASTTPLQAHTTFQRIFVSYANCVSQIAESDLQQLPPATQLQS